MYRRAVCDTQQCLGKQSFLIEALNHFEAVVLNIFCCFKASDRVRNGDICWPNPRCWIITMKQNTGGFSAFITVILLNKVCVEKCITFKQASVFTPRQTDENIQYSKPAQHRNLMLLYFWLQKTIHAALE